MRRMATLIKMGAFTFADYTPYVSYSERKRQFLHHVRFWLDRIRKTRPTALIHLNGSPHLVAEYVLFEVCKLLGVPTIFLTFTPITPKILLTRDLGRYVGDLAGLAASYLATFRSTGKPPTVDAVTQLFIDQQTGDDKAARPAHLNTANINHSRGYLIQFRSPKMVAKQFARDCLDALLKRQPFSVAFLRYALYWHLLYNDRRLRKRYAARAVAPDLAQDFIYLPLHYQPEETTSPLGGAYESQLLIAEMLSYYAPPGWKVYVKEHPAQNSYGRNPSLYDDLARLKNVTLIGTEANSYDLIRNCRAVATISGTSGWEALFRGKPVLVFGHVPYEHAHGAFRIRSAEDCRAAIHCIKQGEFNIDVNTMTCFLRALQDCSIDFRLNTAGVSLPSHFAEVPADTNRSNLVDAILDALSALPQHAELPATAT